MDEETQVLPKLASELSGCAQAMEKLGRQFVRAKKRAPTRSGTRNHFMLGAEIPRAVGGSHCRLTTHSCCNYHRGKQQAVTAFRTFLQK